MKNEDVYTILSETELELNLPKLLKLTDSNKRDLIIKLFDDMMFACHSGIEYVGGVTMHPIKIGIIYRTLLNNGYLINNRGAKLEKLID